MNSAIKKFTQVTRTAAGADADLLDPLSMFALEGTSAKSTKSNNSTKGPTPLHSGVPNTSSYNLKGLSEPIAKPAPTATPPELLSTPNLKKKPEMNSRSSSPVPTPAKTPAKSVHSAAKPPRRGGIGPGGTIGSAIGGVGVKDSGPSSDSEDKDKNKEDEDYCFKFLTGRCHMPICPYAHMSLS
jgi:hypothetical protein